MSNPTLPNAENTGPRTAAQPESDTGTGRTRGPHPDLRLIGGMPIWTFAALLAAVVAASLTDINHVSDDAKAVREHSLGALIRDPASSAPRWARRLRGTRLDILGYRPMGLTPAMTPGWE